LATAEYENEKVPGTIILTSYQKGNTKKKIGRRVSAGNRYGNRVVSQIMMGRVGKPVREAVTIPGRTPH
jgi:hypothetical protein